MDLPPLVCGACTACCRGPDRKLELHVDDDPSEYDTDIDHYGRVTLANREGGDCVYVSDQGCTIHARRPKACRQYDCRLLLDHPGAPQRVKLEGIRRAPAEFVVAVIELLAKDSRKLRRLRLKPPATKIKWHTRE
jgi:hypothetical protein